MSKDTTESDSVKERLDTVEEQIDQLDFGDIDNRMERIEREQAELRTDLETVVEALRKHGNETPHIESVEGLYARLENLEENIGSLRESLEEIVDDSR